jgi:hypothetical protein
MADLNQKDLSQRISELLDGLQTISEKKRYRNPEKLAEGINILNSIYDCLSREAKTCSDREARIFLDLYRTKRDGIVRIICSAPREYNTYLGYLDANVQQHKYESEKIRV